jgi:hypothetical protein
MMEHTLNSTRVMYNEDEFTLSLKNAQLRTLSKGVIAKATHNKEYHACTSLMWVLKQSVSFILFRYVHAM